MGATKKKFCETFPVDLFWWSSYVNEGLLINRETLELLWLTGSQTLTFDWLVRWKRKEGVCAYLVLFVFLDIWSEEIHLTNPVINKLGCTAAFDIRPLKTSFASVVFLCFRPINFTSQFTDFHAMLTLDYCSAESKKHHDEICFFVFKFWWSFLCFWQLAFVAPHEYIYDEVAKVSAS